MYLVPVPWAAILIKAIRWQIKQNNCLLKQKHCLKTIQRSGSLKKMIATLRMMGDVVNRFPTYGPQASSALDKAKQLNPDNPRVYVLEGLDKFNTPEQWGGSKEEAKKLFEKANLLYQTIKPESAIHPNWGRGMLNYYLSQLK